VFLPLVFMSGLVGRIFREFAITIVISIFASGIVSLTLTPNPIIVGLMDTSATVHAHVVARGFGHIPLNSVQFAVFNGNDSLLASQTEAVDQSLPASPLGFVVDKDYTFPINGALVALSGTKYIMVKILDPSGNTLTQTNIATGSATYYTWDYRNRLTEVKVENSQNQVLNDEKFTYDVFNNRIGVSLNGMQQLWTVYDGANPYIDFNGSGTLTQRYLANPQGLSQFYDQVSGSGTTQWFLTDNLGSIRQVISTGGSLLDAITFDPYGNIVSQTNAANAPRIERELVEHLKRRFGAGRVGGSQQRSSSSTNAQLRRAGSASAAGTTATWRRDALAPARQPDRPRRRLA